MPDPKKPDPAKLKAVPPSQPKAPPDRKWLSTERLEAGDNSSGTHWMIPLDNE